MTMSDGGGFIWVFAVAYFVVLAIVAWDVIHHYTNGKG